LRGLLNHGVEDLRGGLVRQVARWVECGVLCDAHARCDCLEALRGHPLPLLVVAAEEDPICSPGAALEVLDLWGADARSALVVREPCGHLDLVQGDLCRRVTGPAVVRWLTTHRRRAW
jgi:pimeloyl-ACP methyl ester carboxylesterase